MANFWLKIKFWSKITFFSAIVLYMLIFVAKNSRNNVEFWYWFGRSAEASVLKFSLLAVGAGIVFAIVVSTTFKTIRQVREVTARNRAERASRGMTDLEAKAAMLRTKPPAAMPTAIPPSAESPAGAPKS